MRLGLALLVFALPLFLGCNDDEPTEVPTPQGQKIYVSDWNYVQGKYFFLINPNETSPPGSITGIHLYLDDKDPRNDVELGALPANVWRDPRNKTAPAVSGQFHLLADQIDYLVSNDPYFSFPRIELTNALAPYMTLAVAYIQTMNAVPETVGTWMTYLSDPETVLDLKMVRPSDDQWENVDLTLSPWSDVRYLEAKNVYGLGVHDIEAGTMRVDIVRDLAGPTGQNPNFITNEFHKTTLLLQVLGLDQKNNLDVTNRTPDGRIDPEYVDLADGLILFPDLRPFDPDLADIEGTTVRGRSWPRDPNAERPDTLGWHQEGGLAVPSNAEQRYAEVVPEIYDLRFTELSRDNLRHHKYTIVVTLNPY